MLTIKKRAPIILLAVGVALLGWSGCTPAGPRALLKGEKLIEQGRYNDAVRELEKAVAELTENAQAWNHLGLAYHYSGQTNQALEAYQQALRRDRNLAPAFFNAGVLQLELNQLPTAIDSLRTFTVFRPNDFDGWLKLATAQFRHSAQLPAAEKKRSLEQARTSMQTALRLRSNPEALNLYGMILLQRNQTREAIGAFNTALQQQPNYAPALLNLAVLYHQQPQVRDPRLALRLYHDYLKLQPDAPQLASVQNAIHHLQQELAPPQVAVVPDVPPPVTNTLARAAPPRPAPPETSQAPPVHPPPPGEFRADTLPIRTNATETAGPPPGKAPALSPAPVPVPDQPVETAQVPAPAPVAPVEETIRPVPDLPPGAPPEPGIAEQTGGTTRPIAPPSSPDPKPSSTAAAPPVPSGSGKRSAVTPLPGTRTYPRYTYRAPAVPAPGNRREAERLFRQALEAHQQRRPAEAMAAYRRAAEADPAFFEALANMGLAAFETGQFEAAAQAYERAVALRPAAASTRYNFAMALMRANYQVDAANELVKVVQQTPSDARAHLALGNIYAQHLHQTALAREHYQKVVQLEPRHPEAVRIRYWLAANP